MCLASITLLLIAAFRSIYFAPDTLGYVIRYINLSESSINTYWGELINNTEIGIKDPFFYFITSIIHSLGFSYRWWLAFIALTFIYSSSWLIYKYSDEPYISYISLISLGYFYFSLTGLRQILAVSFILISYKYLREKRLVWFVLLVMLASLFHTSALIFLIAYPFSYIKLGIKQMLLIFTSLFLIMFFYSRIFDLIEIIAWDDRIYYYLVHDRALNFSGFIIHLLIFLFCLYHKEKIVDHDIKNISLYNLLILGLIFQFFSNIIAEFFRVAMYFNIFSIILIPKSLAAIKNKKKKIITYVFILFSLVTYIIHSGKFYDFQFFWEI